MKILNYEDAIAYLKENLDSHKPSSSQYRKLEKILKEIGLTQIEDSKLQKQDFTFRSVRGKVLVFPYLQMGSVSTVDLLRADELIMFAFYDLNIQMYDVFYDLGANVGLHSLVVAGLGVNVIAYEPDNIHFGILVRNIELNNFRNVDCRNAAIGISNGDVQFIRVLGNTTSSHIKGEKTNPYGILEEFTVRCDELDSQLGYHRKSLLKIDIEGMEAKLIQSISKTNWSNIDAFVEVGTKDNAYEIFKFCEQNGLRIYAQQNSWTEIMEIKEMPMSYKDGSIFLSTSDMKWR
jgi:FkbM family methyltransferase